MNLSYETPAAEIQTENGAAAYRIRDASKSIPGFDMIDYGQEDYVFSSSKQNARHWNKFVLEIFEKYADVLEPLFSTSDCRREDTKSEG